MSRPRRAGSRGLKAVIVAAGEGKRLRPLTEDLPKCLLPVGGRPLILHSLDALNALGVEDVALVVGHGRERLVEALGPGYRYLLNPFYQVTNNMASLWFAKTFVEDSEFLYLHSDLLYESSVLSLATEDPHNIVLLVKQKNTEREEMKVVVEDGYLVESSKEVEPHRAYGEWLGIAKFTPRGWERYVAEVEQLLLEGRYQAYDTEAMTRLSQKERLIHVADVGGLSYIEIDSSEDLKRAQQQIWSKIEKKARST